jgi:hypothetical protein
MGSDLLLFGSLYLGSLYIIFKSITSTQDITGILPGSIGLMAVGLERDL